MRNAHACSILVLFVAASLDFASRVEGAPRHAPVLIAGHDLVRPKEDVPDDPLAGMYNPDEGASPGRRGRGGGRKHKPATCAIQATAQNDRDIGDLRATLAVVTYGPLALPCPTRMTGGGLRLRVHVTSAGTIVTVDPTAGDAASATAIGKKLLGKTIAPRAEGATAGVVVVTFANGKG